VKRDLGRNLNACFTRWPGGLNYFPPGEPLPGGWVRTRIVGGFVTNPRCWPPKTDVLEKLSGGGTLFEAAQQARTAAAIIEAQRLDAERRARWREYFKLPLPGEALSLRAVEGSCGKKPGPWACFARWPGGWLPFDHPQVKAHPEVWKGPTPYGQLLPACFGYVEAPSRKIGNWLTDTLGRKPKSGVIIPGAAAAPLPGAPAPAPTPYVSPEPTPFDAPPIGTPIYASHPAGPWGNAAYYEGGYVSGIEDYWQARGGDVYLSEVAAKAAIGF